MARSQAEMSRKDCCTQSHAEPIETQFLFYMYQISANPYIDVISQVITITMVAANGFHLRLIRERKLEHDIFS